ncbi:hypothetical protein ASG87_06050 [Frateuria sp. Soil773]|nr:hypothetical protein ASG87_06050 [Frateuria sp. Soil773]
MAGSTAAHAQATAGSIFGKAPVGATVSAHNTTGAQRHVSVDAKGRYTIGALPVGIYTVELELDGHVVSQKNGVQIIVGRGFKLDFDCANDQCKGPSNG